MIHKEGISVLPIHLQPIISYGLLKPVNRIPTANGVHVTATNATSFDFNIDIYIPIMRQLKILLGIGVDIVANISP